MCQLLKYIQHKSQFHIQLELNSTVMSAMQWHCFVHLCLHTQYLTTFDKLKQLMSCLARLRNTRLNHRWIISFTNSQRIIQNFDEQIIHNLTTKYVKQTTEIHSRKCRLWIRDRSVARFTADAKLTSAESPQHTVVDTSVFAPATVDAGMKRWTRLSKWPTIMSCKNFCLRLSRSWSITWKQKNRKYKNLTKELPDEIHYQNYNYAVI